MTAPPAFAFAITYDADSVKAAAQTLFLMQQRRTLWLSLGSLAFCFVTIGVISWYFGFFWMLWFPFGLLVLNVSLALYVRWAIRRRLDRTLRNRSAQIELSDTAFSIAGENGSHVLPWKNFKSTRRDAKNLFLCFPRPGAIVLPANVAPKGAFEYIEARVRHANMAA
jgi:hypothetical protein